MQQVDRKKIVKIWESSTHLQTEFSKVILYQDFKLNSNFYSEKSPAIHKHSYESNRICNVLYEWTMNKKKHSLPVTVNTIQHYLTMLLPY